MFAVRLNTLIPGYLLLYVKNRTREFTATRFFFFFHFFLFFSFFFLFFFVWEEHLATNTRSISARYIASRCATKTLSRNRFEIRERIMLLELFYRQAKTNSEDLIENMIFLYDVTNVNECCSYYKKKKKKKKRTVLISTMKFNSSQLKI